MFYVFSLRQTFSLVSIEKLLLKCVEILFFIHVKYVEDRVQSILFHLCILAH